jgi:hypothetical protein
MPRHAIGLVAQGGPPALKPRRLLSDWGRAEDRIGRLGQMLGSVLEVNLGRNRAAL